MRATYLQLKVMLVTFLCALAIPGAVSATAKPAMQTCQQLNEHVLMRDLQTLASDAFAGRKPGTAGHAKASDYLAQRFKTLNLLEFDGRYIHPFMFKNDQPGNNVIGYLKGRHAAQQYLIITAHYDHLGSKGSRIYNGADDNASGVAAMLTVASHFSKFAPSHSMIFVATDAEEAGLYGAYAFLRTLPVARSSVLLNINVDMIGQGGNRDQLYLVQDGKHSKLKTVLEQVRDRVSAQHLRLYISNARSRLSRLTRNSRIDWHDASDYAAFARYDIPFVHIGTDIHSDYHTPDDNLNNIDTEFFVTSAGITRCVVEAFDNAID